MSDGTTTRVAAAAQVVGALALVGIALGYCAREGAERGPPPSGAADAGVAAALAEWRADVRRLEERLTQRHGAVPEPAAAAAGEGADGETARAPLPGTVVDTSSIAEQLAALRREIRSAADRLVSERAPLAEQSARPTNWVAIEAFQRAYAQDLEAARQELLLSSPSQIAMRFGKPTKVQFWRDGEPWFLYERGEEPLLEVYFHAGVVTRVRSYQ